MTNHDIAIVAAKRTPIGAFQGFFKSTKATALGSTAIRSALLSTGGIPPETVDEVYMGCVLPAGLGQAPARQAALGADLPHSVPCTTINKVCGSGMKAVMIACDQLKLESANIVVAGGMENMSQAPYLLDNARFGYRFGHNTLIDHMLYDGLEDAYHYRAMGTFADDTADALNFSREDQDSFAKESLERAQKAQAAGCFTSEIVPIEIMNNRIPETITFDEVPTKVTAEKITKLKPAFKENGTVTAANSSSISDGAAALVLMTSQTAKQQGHKPLGLIKGYVSYAQAPEWFTTAPCKAIPKLCKEIGWSLADVDLFEINEAFAVVTMAALKELSLPPEKVNIFGGACALGHPIGASGARIIVTLLHALRQKGLKRGIASLCIGGGEATAIAVEIP